MLFWGVVFVWVFCLVLGFFCNLDTFNSELSDLDEQFKIISCNVSAFPLQPERTVSITLSHLFISDQSR